MAAKKKAAGKADFSSIIKQGYSPAGSFVLLGKGMLDGKILPDAEIKIPVKTLNRHGLIAGATGTGKTKSLMTLAGELSKLGIPSLVMDVKGDISGLGAAGSASGPAADRMKQLGLTFKPKAYPVELLSLSDEKGLRLRATVSEFGPVLISKILGLNETQEGILSVLFKFCDDRGLLLLDLKDLKSVLNFATGDGKAEFAGEFGQVSGASAGTILRKVVALEQQGAEIFFGEPSFDTADLKRTSGKEGVISIVRLTDIQSRPDLFSTFMLQLLAEVFEKFPEVGDRDKPELILFIDEAHLIFNSASKALLAQIESIVKLIRSRGVGIIFCTQSPDDIPSAVLSQLGLKIQHALRAFTAKDRKTVQKAAENFPLSDFYETDRLLGELGIGEALITCLDEKGRPAPLAHTMVAAPDCRLDILSAAEIESIVKKSNLAGKYSETQDRKSAYETLAAKVESLAEEAPVGKKSAAKAKAEKSTMEKVLESPITKEIGRTAAREITRGVLGVFGIGGRKSSRRKKGFF